MNIKLILYILSCIVERKQVLALYQLYVIVIKKILFDIIKCKLLFFFHYFIPKCVSFNKEKKCFYLYFAKLNKLIVGSDPILLRHFN